MNQIDKNLGTKPLVPLVADEDFSPEYRELMERMKAKGRRLTNSARASAHASEMSIVVRDFIANVYDYENHPAFDERERAALSFVDAMMADASNISDAIAKRFVDNFTPQERVEIAYVATTMGVLNKFNDAFRVPIEDEVVGIAIDVPDFSAGGKT